MHPKFAVSLFFASSTIGMNFGNIFTCRTSICNVRREVNFTLYLSSRFTQVPKQMMTNDDSSRFLFQQTIFYVFYFFLESSQLWCISALVCSLSLAIEIPKTLAVVVFFLLFFSSRKSQSFSNKLHHLDLGIHN